MTSSCLYFPEIMGCNFESKAIEIHSSLTLRLLRVFATAREIKQDSVLCRLNIQLAEAAGSRFKASLI